MGRHPEGRLELLLDFPLDEREKRPAIPFHLAIDEHLLRPVPLPVADAKLEPSPQPSIQLDVSRQIRRRFEIVRRNAALETDGARGAPSAPEARLQPPLPALETVGIEEDVIVEDAEPSAH